MPHFLATIHDNRWAFGRVTVFVRIGGNAGDAGKPEIEKRKWKSGFFHERDEESAETGVDVDGNAVSLAQSGDVGDWVDTAWDRMKG